MKRILKRFSKFLYHQGERYAGMASYRGSYEASVPKKLQKQHVRKEE